MRNPPLFSSTADEEARMKIDTSKAGRRCRARKTFRAHELLIEAQSEGTVIHEIDNLGRRMILVRWDGNSSLYVLPDEIELIDDSRAD